jgi:aryl-alcohol dehydrogenase-like predicted oxidoreductase
MQYRFLGKTGLQVSELCLGTGSFDTTGEYRNCGDIKQKEADYIVSMAMDAGINFFNTAEIYSEGRAEITLGKALGPRRQEAIIITKVHPTRGPGPNDGGHSRKHIIEGCNASLKRLNTDYVDIYELHAFDPATPLEETLRALDDLVRDGKVRYIGCSNFTAWQVMKALAISSRNGWERFVTLEAMYSLVSRELEYELVPMCLDQGVAILVFSPLHGGYLGGKYRRGRPWPSGTRFNKAESIGPWPVDSEKLYDIVEELEKVARNHNTSIPGVALNYLLRKPGVASLIIGIRDAKQLEENIKATNWALTSDEMEHLDGISEPVRKYPYYVYDPVKVKDE